MEVIPVIEEATTGSELCRRSRVVSIKANLFLSEPAGDIEDAEPRNLLLRQMTGV